MLRDYSSWQDGVAADYSESSHALKTYPDYCYDLPTALNKLNDTIIWLYKAVGENVYWGAKMQV